MDESFRRNLSVKEFKNRSTFAKVINKNQSGCFLKHYAFINKQELIRRWDSERELFTMTSHTYFKIGLPKRKPTSFNKLDDIARQLLRIKYWIDDSATEFPPCSYRIFIPWASRGPVCRRLLLDIVIVNCP